MSVYDQELLVLLLMNWLDIAEFQQRFGFDLPVELHF